MKVDILLISYNQEKYIAEAVESILMQQVDENVRLRLVVADDHSPDNTLGVIRETRNKKQETSNRLEWVFLPEEENLGISKNYQRAFAACDGDYIAVMEGDDYWTSERHLQQHIDFLEAHKECSMSMNDIAGGHGAGYRIVDWKQQITMGNQLGNLSACMFRTACIKQLPDIAYGVHLDDYLLGVLLSQIAPIGILEESTSVYRCNEQSMWASMSNWRKFRRNLEFADMYDRLQDGKYHDLWQICKRNIIHAEYVRIRTNIAHWFSGKGVRK